MPTFDTRPGGVYRSTGEEAMPAIAHEPPESICEAESSAVSVPARFLDLPINAAFCRREDGSVTFHPWPWPLRVGYVLPSAMAESRLRRVMKRWLLAALPAFVLFGALGPQAIVALGSAYVAAYYLRILFALRGLPRTFEPAAIAFVRQSRNQAGRAVADGKHSS